jgi:P27 family predicted phage terminase small subunit
VSGIKGQRSGGRTRKPRALHVIEGTFKASRHAGADVEAPAGVPDVPQGLVGVALEAWRALTTRMSSQGTLSLVDDIALENHVRLHALVVRIEAEVAALPALTYDKDGEPKAHPLVAQLRAGRMALRTSLQEFGMSPSSRTRVTRPVTPAADPLAKYRRR